MKTLFKILLSLLVLLLLSGVGGYFYMRQKFTPPANQLVVSGLPLTTDFTWQTSTAAGRSMPHAGLLVPVQLPGCARTCYMQFDTGSPSTIVYSRPMAALQARYPALPFAHVAGADTMGGFRFGLGQGAVRARRVRVLVHGAAEIPADTAAPFIIGTLGADVLEGGALVIDYAHRRFSLLERVPDSLAQRARFGPLAFANRRVIFDMSLQG